MLRKQVQIKINMPLKLKKAIEKRASKYDLTLAAYVKYALVGRLEEELSFKASKAVEKAYKNMLNGKADTVSLDSLEKMRAYVDKMK